MDVINDIEKVYMINWFTYYDRNNLKLKQLFEYIQNDDMFIEINDVTTKDIITFIKDNYESKYILLFTIYSQDFKNNKNYTNWNSMVNIMNIYLKQLYNIINYTRSLDKHKCHIKIVISPMDIFNGTPQRTRLNRLLYTYPENHFIMPGTINLKSFRKYIIDHSENRTLTNETKHLLLNKTRCFTPFCCYKILEFNQNPINKIAVCGKIISLYPERTKLIKYLNVNIISYNWNDRLSNNNINFLKKIHNYKCCFVSNPKRTHIDSPVLKFYEILSTGSLLLCSTLDKQSHKYLGLENNINCIMIDFNDSNKITDTIKYILDPVNEVIINKIRGEGHKLAKEVLTPLSRYQHLKDIINTL